MSILKSVRSVILVLCAFGLVLSPVSAQTPKGHLFIIGGGNRPPEMMRQFVELAGGPGKAKVLVITNASADYDTECTDMTAEFHSLGVADIRCVLFTREEALDPRAAEHLIGTTGIFFTGGDQSRVTSVLVGTPVHQKLKDLYAAGAVIGGTSAGAALMSKVMITGDERVNKDTVRNFRFIKKNNVVTVEGMGFITNAIIDQHFIARKRHNRLISVVLEHPELIGVGIDESTAIIVRPPGMFEVTGAGNVIVYDATRAKSISEDRNGNLSANEITMHVLKSGDRYDIGAHRVEPTGMSQ